MSASLLALVAAYPALAQTPPETAQSDPASPAAPPDAPMGEEDVNAIIVTAARVGGMVQTDNAPVVELDEKDIESYGASSIQDLVAQLAPQVGSGNGRGGRPVFLVNGQRVTNFREIFRYPPEALKRVEVLPEQVALKFGFSAEQRVINFILKDNYASREVEAEIGGPTDGGYTVGEVELSQLQINGKQRLNASVEYARTSALTEAERGIIQTGAVPTVPGSPDIGDYRTLVGRSDNFEANLSSTRALGEDGMGGQLTLNGQYVRNTGTSLSGLDLQTLPNGDVTVIDPDPITRHTTSDTYSLGAGFNTRLGDYQFQTTFDASLADSESEIDRRRTAPGAVIQDFAQSRVWSASNKTTLIGQPFDLPAGGLSVTLDAGYNWSRIESEDSRTGLGQITLTRGDANGGANISIPIASRRAGVWDAIGDLSFNIGGGVNHVSDFGTLGNWTTGLVWSPAEPLTLNATYTEREAAPGLNQLGGPVTQSFNVPYYDFATGQSVLITQTSGGNPNLLAETQRDLKLSANYDLDLLDRTNIVVEYYRNRSDDVTSSFPALTSAIEAAFPERVTRDPAGDLTAIDTRPVTFAETRSERLRYGFNIFGKLGKPYAEGEAPARGGRGGLFAAMRGAGSGQSGGQANSQSGGQASASGEGSGQGSGAMRFDPQRMAALRERFCSTPEGQIPDLSGIPEPILARLKGENGEIDPARVAVMRERFCSADSQQRFDPARFAAMRQALCADPAKEPDPAAIPPAVLDRLKGPDGTVDPVRLKEFQTRICALPQTGQGNGENAQSRGEGGGSGGENRDGGGRRGGGGGPGGNDGQGRWNLGIYHTINLVNSVLIAEDGPFLDLLDGDATGSGGGVSRHQFEIEGGGFYRGLGARLSGNYRGATRVNGSGLPGSSDLFFGDLITFDLRLFMALDQQEWLVGSNPGFFKDARLSLRVNNLFDTRQRVTDENGEVPLRYQPFLIDPTGRFVEIEFRKLF